MKKTDGIKIELVNAMNFRENSLDAFVRYQEVEYVYRLKKRDSQ